jgi:hypothetical protein
MRRRRRRHRGGSRALGENKNYGELELPSGRKAKIIAGNLVAGVLGARQALLGYMGDVPKTLEPGDHIHLLNMGGVLGICESWNSRFGSADFRSRYSAPSCATACR